MLKSLPITDSYRRLHTHMKRDFPANEMPPYFIIKRNFKKGVYRGFYLLDDGKEVGYAIVTAPEGNAFALINFLAVHPEERAKGYGTSFLKILREMLGLHLVLEVEAPAAAKDDDERRLRERRISFYEASGFRILPTSRTKIFGVAMEIMTNAEEWQLPQDFSVRRLIQSLYLPALSSECFLKFIDVADA